MVERKLADKVGDVVARPRTEEMSSGPRARAGGEGALDVRGAGTGNYGQAVPLEGGVIL